MAFIRKLTAENKDELTQKVLDVYQEDPERLRELLPEVAILLDEFQSHHQTRRVDRSSFGLTERERNFHTGALENILRRFRSLDQAGAVKGLEHGANLLVDDFTPGYPPRQELLKLVRKATGIQPRKTGKPVETVVREGESSRIVPVVRGVDLHLTWQFKLIKVTMDPYQWRLRSQALGIIGIGKDTADDVAKDHDDYLVDAFENG